jgi:hypothetical protein
MAQPTIEEIRLSVTHCRRLQSINPAEPVLKRVADFEKVYPSLVVSRATFAFVNGVRRYRSEQEEADVLMWNQGVQGVGDLEMYHR